MANADDDDTSNILSAISFPVRYPTHQQSLPQLVAYFGQNNRSHVRSPSYSNSGILIPPQIVEPDTILVAGDEDEHPDSGSPHMEMTWIAEFFYRWFTFMDHDSSAQQDTAGFIVYGAENLPGFATTEDEQEFDEIFPFTSHNVTIRIEEERTTSPPLTNHNVTIGIEEEHTTSPPLTNRNVTIGIEEERTTSPPLTNNIEPVDENLLEPITIGNEELGDEELVAIHLLKWLRGLLHPKALLTIDCVLFVRFLLSKPRQALTANSLTIFCIVVHAMAYLILCILSWIYKRLELKLKLIQSGPVP